MDETMDSKEGQGNINGASNQNPKPGPSNNISHNSSATSGTPSYPRGGDDRLLKPTTHRSEALAPNKKIDDHPKADISSSWLSSSGNNSPSLKGNKGQKRPIPSSSSSDELSGPSRQSKNQPNRKKAYMDESSTDKSLPNQGQRKGKRPWRKDRSESDSSSTSKVRRAKRNKFSNEFSLLALLEKSDSLSRSEKRERTQNDSSLNLDTSKIPPPQAKKQKGATNGPLASSPKGTGVCINPPPLSNSDISMISDTPKPRRIYTISESDPDIVDLPSPDSSELRSYR